MSTVTTLDFEQQQQQLPMIAITASPCNNLGNGFAILQQQHTPPAINVQQSDQ